jgi:membrane-associated phospholipid phosphatase
VPEDESGGFSLQGRRRPPQAAAADAGWRRVDDWRHYDPVPASPQPVAVEPEPIFKPEVVERAAHRLLERIDRPPALSGETVSLTLLRRAALIGIALYALVLLDVAFNGLLARLDAATVGFFASSPTWAVVWVGGGLSLLADTIVMVVLTVLLVLFVLFRRSVRQAGVVLGSILGLTAVIAAAKFAVARARPLPPEALSSMPGILIPETFSFPSGHAAMGVLAWGLVLFALTASPPTADGDWRISRRALVAVAVLGGLAGVSRLLMGVHYPSDIVAGWALGISWLAATLAVWRHVIMEPAPDAVPAFEEPTGSGPATGPPKF